MTNKNKENKRMESNIVLRNRKVAQNRGEKWKSNLLLGKLDDTAPKLQSIRVKKQLSQAAMAKKLGCSLITYGDIERGNRKAKKDRVSAICNLLNAKQKDVFKPVDDELFLAI